jgi:hypothetical protein
MFGASHFQKGLSEKTDFWWSCCSNKFLDYKLIWLIDYKWLQQNWLIDYTTLQMIIDYKNWLDWLTKWLQMTTNWLIDYTKLTEWLQIDHNTTYDWLQHCKWMTTLWLIDTTNWLIDLVTNWLVGLQIDWLTTTLQMTMIDYNTTNWLQMNELQIEWLTTTNWQQHYTNWLIDYNCYTWLIIVESNDNRAIQKGTCIHGHRTLKAPHPVRSAQLTRVPPS